MLEKLLLVFAICCLSNGSSEKTSTTTTTTSKYRELYRDHVYTKLTNKGKDMFYSLNVHPACVAKKGYCVARGKCTGRDMLYISRICYKNDLVCCYDNSIKWPEVAWKEYTPPPALNDTREVYVEPPELP